MIHLLYEYKGQWYGQNRYVEHLPDASKSPNIGRYWNMVWGFNFASNKFGNVVPSDWIQCPNGWAVIPKGTKVYYIISDNKDKTYQQTKRTIAVPYVWDFDSNCEHQQTSH